MKGFKLNNSIQKYYQLDTNIIDISRALFTWRLRILNSQYKEGPEMATIFEPNILHFWCW